MKLILVGLLFAVLTTSVFAQGGLSGASGTTPNPPPPPIKDTLESLRDKSNVVLGRELVMVSRSLVDAVQLQQETLRLKIEIGGMATDNISDMTTASTEMTQIKER